MNNSPLVQQSIVKDLGVIFDEKLKFDHHIDSVVRKAYSMLGFIMRATTDFHDMSCIRFLYNSLVRSRLEYNTATWNPYQDTYIKKIERVQRKYTRILFYKLQYNAQTYEQRLHTLNLLKLESRREYFDACFLYNVIQNEEYCADSRPVLRANPYSNRSNITFNPLPRNNDYELHRNPVMRTQLLYERKFRHVDIINLGINAFAIMSSFSQ